MEAILNFLTEDEIERIHNASLEVLGNTGIKVMSKKALDVLKGAGASVFACLDKDIPYCGRMNFYLV